MMKFFLIFCDIIFLVRFVFGLIFMVKEDVVIYYDDGFGKFIFYVFFMN